MIARYIFDQVCTQKDFSRKLDVAWNFLSNIKIKIAKNLPWWIASVF